jgi:hypothetical protein
VMQSAAVLIYKNYSRLELLVAVCVEELS